jgi:hypothetical protein
MHLLATRIEGGVPRPLLKRKKVRRISRFLENTSALYCT